MKTAFWLPVGRAALLVAAGLISGPLNADATIEQVLDGLDPGVASSEARIQMEAGEFGAAVILSETAVRAIEESSSRYDRSLVEALVLLGDARLALQDAEGALGAYERALFLMRINDGLHAPEQLDIVYRQADAYAINGDPRGANHRFEYAYQLMRRTHGTDDVQILPSLLKLADWYEAKHFSLAARELYEEALRVLRSEPPSRDRVDVLQRFARTYLNQAFPRPSPGYSERPFTPRPTGAMINRQSGRLFGQPIPFNKYVAAERSLMKAVQIVTELPDGDDVELAKALLELADWWLMFKEWGKAFEGYARIWTLLEENDPELLASIFGEPIRIYIREPGNPDPTNSNIGNREPRLGSVEYVVRVTRQGELRDAKTVRADPEDLDYIRFRQALPTARYRPAFVDGKPVATEGVRVVFDFVY